MFGLYSTVLFGLHLWPPDCARILMVTNRLSNSNNTYKNQTIHVPDFPAKGLIGGKCNKYR